MAAPIRLSPFRRFSPSLLILWILLAVLWLAGGASRADVLGQLVTRVAAWTALCAIILIGDRPSRSSLASVWPVSLLLLAALALALVQLIPLPPALWQSIPGRAVFTEAAAASGQPQPWRPWSIVPGATFNAACSLVVPFAVLACLIGLRPAERHLLPGTVLLLVTVSMLIGLLQFSGSGFDNPLVNDTPGDVTGTFANRNHFALFIAFGCAVAPVWAFPGSRRPGWRAPAAIGLLLMFVLTILATGSRSGILVGMVALGAGLAMVQQGIRRTLERYPRWVFPAFVTAIIVLIVIVVLLSVAADRAVSIDRAIGNDPGQDMRTRGLPVVLSMIGRYFPAGTGLGSFDPLFRLHEPFALLKPTYFNHAHNDWLEVLLDTGLAGGALLVAATGWWGWASYRAWGRGWSVRLALPKLGSTVLLMTMIASLFDYPARTPLIMAIVVIAGLWLQARDEKAADFTRE
jgi:O-antigen ligase